MDEATLRRLRLYGDIENGVKRNYVVNKAKKGLYENVGSNHVSEDSLDINMTRRNFDDYLLKCIAEMKEFMIETAKHVEGLNHLLDTHIETTNNVFDEVAKEINIIRNIQQPDKQDVHLINRRLDILANKLELLAKQTGKSELLKSLLSNVFSSEAR